jgi:hypothetical protein
MRVFEANAEEIFACEWLKLVDIRIPVDALQQPDALCLLGEIGQDFEESPGSIGRRKCASAGQS